MIRKEELRFERDWPFGLKAEETRKEKGKAEEQAGAAKGRLSVMLIEFVTQTFLAHFLVSVPFSFHLLDQSQGRNRTEEPMS